jgi:hypothetical protein
VYLRYFIAWYPIVIIPFANATIREAVYKPPEAEPKYLGEQAAHQVSTLTMCILVGIYVWVLSSYWKLHSAGQAIGVGLMWFFTGSGFDFVYASDGDRDVINCNGQRAYRIIFDEGLDRFERRPGVNTASTSADDRQTRVLLVTDSQASELVVLD